MADPAFEHLRAVGTMIAVRVTPKASRNRVVIEGERVRIYVTTVPEGGKATAMVQKLLAKSLGVAKTRLVLRRGKAARDKVFEVM